MMNVALSLLLCLFHITAHANAYIAGADLSFLSQMEDDGVVFRDEDEVSTDSFSIFRQNGINAARFRLWVNPTDEYCSLDDVLALATRAKAAGMDEFLLDFHYSDTWADPGHQTKPVAWNGLSFEQLVEQVYTYTFDAVDSLVKAGVTPTMVQVGNEISNGLLWPEGSLDNKEQMIALIRAGTTAVRKASPSTEIALHINKGSDNELGKWFFGLITDNTIDFDVMGFSYYPWWDGTLQELEFNLQDMVDRFDRDVAVFEVAYPFSLGWNDDYNNIVGGEEGQLPEYPYTPEGQMGFVEAVRDIVMNTSRGRGVYYWAPDWIVKSHWENLALFDFDRVALPALGAMAPPETDAPTRTPTDPPARTPTDPPTDKPVGSPTDTPVDSPTETETKTQANCFSGRSTVEVQGKGVTRIDQLKIGDAVQQMDGSYSTVYSFAHRAPEQIVDFLQIYTTSTKEPLEISDEHMVIANGLLVPAAQVKVGDALVAVNNGATPTIVTKIGPVSLKGAYAPYTQLATLLSVVWQPPATLL